MLKPGGLVYDPSAFDSLTDSQLLFHMRLIPSDLNLPNTFSLQRAKKKQQKKKHSKSLENPQDCHVYRCELHICGFTNKNDMFLQFQDQGSKVLKAHALSCSGIRVYRRGFPPSFTYFPLLLSPRLILCCFASSISSRRTWKSSSMTLVISSVTAQSSCGQLVLAKRKRALFPEERERQQV